MQLKYVRLREVYLAGGNGQPKQQGTLHRPVKHRTISEKCRLSGRDAS